METHLFFFRAYQRVSENVNKIKLSVAKKKGCHFRRISLHIFFFKNQNGNVCVCVCKKELHTRLKARVIYECNIERS